MERGTGWPSGEPGAWGEGKGDCALYLFCKIADESHFDVNCVSLFIVGERQKVKTIYGEEGG